MRGRTLKAIFWASTWGVGVAIGVALGGWLTVVGGAGTPGIEELDVFEDVLMLPAATGAVVFGVHLLGQGLVAVLRRRRLSGEPDEADQ